MTQAVSAESRTPSASSPRPPGLSSFPLRSAAGLRFVRQDGLGPKAVIDVKARSGRVRARSTAG